jgi:hypothetical protein
MEHVMLEWAAESITAARIVAEAHGIPFTDGAAMIDAIVREREGLATWARIGGFLHSYFKAASDVFERPLRALADIAAGAQWLAHGSMYLTRHHGYHENAPTLLRVNGDTVETSQGAEFPLEHGLKALPFIVRAVREGRAYDFTPTREGLGGHGPRLGHFRVDSVSAAGWVRAGCHTVPGFAVAWAARAAGVCEAPELDHVAEIVDRLRDTPRATPVASGASVHLSN